MIFIKICPYLELSFQILGRKWNGLIIHYLSLCKDGKAHFSEIRRELPNITPKALSLKLTELIEFELIEQKICGDVQVSITYELTEKGRALATSLHPIQEWAFTYMSKKNKCER